VFGPAAGHIAMHSDLSAVGDPTAAPVALEGLPRVVATNESVRDHYAEGARGETIALPDSWDMVEVAVVEGNAARELAIEGPFAASVELSAGASQTAARPARR